MTWPLIDWPAFLTLISSSRATCTGVPFTTVRGIVGVITGLASDAAPAVEGTGLFVSTGFATGAGAASWASRLAAHMQENKIAERIRSLIIAPPECPPFLNGVTDFVEAVRRI